MLTKQQVQHIAKLARIALSQEEVKKYRKELSSILDFVEKLKEVEVLGVEPTAHVLPLGSIMRQDQARPADNPGRLVKMAPMSQQGFVKVRRVFNEDGAR